MARCDVCFRHCDIYEGKLGFCGARTVKNGVVIPANYGKITSIALDPIEKKPLARFSPGSKILSVGSYGCNLRCPFCQNYEISWSEEAKRFAEESHFLSPGELVEIANETRDKGNIGIAFTYNEPLIDYEYVLDSAKLAKAHDLKTVIVSNGTAELPILERLAPYIDAMNIDLKGFTDDYYGKILGGNRKQVMDFISQAVKSAHVELTTLIIPDENDTEDEIRALSAWVGSLTNPNGEGVPLHISRFFPRFHMTDRPATDVSKVYRLAEIAREKVEYVYTGNC
ncbi:AmmeMemoRadiSam system radical SAM enzyme [Pseudobutyrivibrio xylanivorans]|uniref:AmmeMemoRadiSam system radical SAM enzyme n=1 Tax=Pseudobutyrivibrio xylanivorans TaxID=185007 RepID=A0A5P6VQA3_PSEXY|nr:AmmeMemoRadiSam system radical SAM enzyme [Pseudobutyrivibrio xylanivorans]QFJ54508.1 AmmeMemoRadiSam system radical SAM enzyme [Pseudobutyrivibrio xylanivorans]